MADNLNYIVPMGHDDGMRIANALEILAGRAVLNYDETAGEYTSQSIAAVLAAHRDGLAYGVRVPKGSATACTKIGAHSGWAAPTPGVVGRPAIDPYAGVGPFFYMNVNAIVDADGYPHVTAVEGDGRYRTDGTNGNVWVLYPVLYWLIDESDTDAVTISVSDTRLSGMGAQPQAYLPDGTLRPFMLVAKYVGVKGDDGKLASVSGRKPWNRSISHNSLITQCATASTGYSGKSIADDWYIKVMFMLKYATKNSQSVFYGALNYIYQYAPTVAETGVTRVIVSNANAANLMVGSAMMLGTHTGNTDRNTASNYDVFDGLRILSMESYDANNTAIYLDTATAFDTDTSYLFSTSPWFSGTLDAVEGDGTLTDDGRTNGHEPYKIQGIECQMGLYEVLGDVIISGDATNGWEPCICYDSANEATSVTANYTHTGKYLLASASAAHHYPLYPSDAGGLLLGQGDGGSQTTGMCDSQYTSALGTGTKEWLGGGHLTYGANGGLWCVYANNALTYPNWIIGSRLSGTGRGRAAA